MDLALAPFTGITLPELDARASLLERTDRKYIVRDEALEEALARWVGDFDVLDIAGHRSFTYDSMYFDDRDHRSFVQHHQGRRIRFKVRTRRYVEAGLCFLEVKLKGARGSTVKKRIGHAEAQFGDLDAAARDYVREAYREVYGRPFDCDLRPAIRVGYNRTTLVARRGGERITIDRQLGFADETGAYAVDRGLAIVETKTATGRGQSDLVLRDLHQHPVSRCSKYCVGMVALRKVDRFNRFRAVARMLNVAVGNAAPGA